jgi:hypothetical protein
MSSVKFQMIWKQWFEALPATLVWTVGIGKGEAAVGHMTDNVAIEGAVEEVWAMGHTLLYCQTPYPPINCAQSLYVCACACCPFLGFDSCNKKIIYSSMHNANSNSHNSHIWCHSNLFCGTLVGVQPKCDYAATLNPPTALNIVGVHSSSYCMCEFHLRVL